MMICKYLLPVILLTGLFLEAAPRRYDDDFTIPIKEMRDSIDDLRREISNHEMEIRTYEHKSSTHEDILEQIRAELKETHQSQKEQLKNNQGNLDQKIGTLETTHKALVADLKQIKGHSTETQEVLKGYRDKISQLEKNLEHVSKNVDLLQNAVSNLMELMKGGAGAVPSGVVHEGGIKIYKVKAGDNLEKIARANGTTIKTIKEINSLTKDQISIGQSLKLPE